MDGKVKLVIMNKEIEGSPELEMKLEETRHKTRHRVEVTEKAIMLYCRKKNTKWLPMFLAKERHCIMIDKPFRTAIDRDQTITLLAYCILTYTLDVRSEQMLNELLKCGPNVNLAYPG